MVFICHPLISVTSHSLPSSLSVSSPLVFLTFIPPSSLYRWCDPHITHHELLRWNPALFCCPTNHRPSLVLCFLSSYPLLLLTLLMGLFPSSDLWHQIRSQGNMRFVFFHTLLELILRNYGRCNPAAHVSLFTEGGRVLENRLTAHIHIRRLKYLAGLRPS